MPSREEKGNLFSLSRSFEAWIFSLHLLTRIATRQNVGKMFATFTRTKMICLPFLFGIMMGESLSHSLDSNEFRKILREIFKGKPQTVDGKLLNLSLPDSQ
jgi:hypothetical protein